MGSIY